MNFISNQSKNRKADLRAKRTEQPGKQTAGARGWITDRLFTVVLVGIMLTGVGLLVYPTFSDYWNHLHQSRAVISYVDDVANMQAADYERILKSAREYNAALSEHGMRWTLTDEEKASYNEELNIVGSGIMGYINIPKIHVTLPIYHGTDEAVLQRFIGHLEGSSLPVGGEGSH